MLVLHEQPQNQISGNSTHQHTHRGVIPDVNWLPLLECSQMLPLSWSAPRCCHCPGVHPDAVTVLECSHMLPLSLSAPRCCHCPGVHPDAATVLECSQMLPLSWCDISIFRRSWTVASSIFHSVVIKHCSSIGERHHE